MDHTEQLGRYQRLQRELVEAYTSRACQGGLIERLTDELATLRRFVQREHSFDEQSSNTTLPGLASD